MGGANLIPQMSVLFTLNRFGKSNEALSLNGSGYYQLPSGSYVSGDFTIMTWARVVQLRNNALFIEIGNAGIQKLILGLSDLLTGNPFVSYIGATPLLSSKVTASRVISLGDWHHLAAVLKGSNQSIYIDGVLVGSSSFAYLPSGALTRSNCYLGSSSNPMTYADFDEIKFFSRALSQDEILDDITFSFY